MSLPTVVGRAVEGVPYREAQSCLGTRFAVSIYQFFVTGTNTPANVYEDGALTIPFPNTGQVTSDLFGRFPPIYLDTSVTYRVQFFNRSGVQQWQVDPYTPPLATVGTSALSTHGFQIAPTGEFTLDAPATGGTGVTLTLVAGKAGSAALEVIGTLPGNSALIVNNSATTGAQTATFTATNKPGTATSSPAGWLPITCDGVQYYTPIWHGNPFTPYTPNPSANGEVINASSVLFGGNGLTTATGGTAIPGNWFSPTSAGIGAGFFISITKTSGLSGVNFSAAQGAFTNIGAGGLTITSNAQAQITGTYQLSTSISGSPVVATGTITLANNNGVQQPAINGPSPLLFGGQGSATLSGGAVDWFTPNTPGVGAGFFLLITPTGGTPGATFSAATGTPANIGAGGLSIGINGGTGAAFSVNGNYVISSDAAGLVQLGTGTITLNGTGAASPTVQSPNWSGTTPLNLAGNGAATLNGVATSDWLTPNAANSGSGFWINITRTGGTTGVNFTAAQGSWTNITNGGLSIGLSGFTGDLGTVSASGTWQISSSSSGTPVLGSGAISLSVAAGGSLTNTYTASGTITVPTGATNAQIELYGSGGGGGNCISAGFFGGGGGGGGVCQTTQAVTAGGTLVLTIGAGGTQSVTGAVSTLVAGTQGLTTMTANGGHLGTAGTSTTPGTSGTGGTCSGGNVGNVTGNAGGSPLPNSGGAGTVGALGAGNAGGAGSNASLGTGAAGGPGQLIIKWT
jgi:hypothetical protein